MKVRISEREVTMVQAWEPLHDNNELAVEIPDALWDEYVEVMDRLSAVQERLMQYMVEEE